VISGCQKVYNPARRVNGAKGCSRAASRRPIADPVAFFQLTASENPSHGNVTHGRLPPWRLTRHYGLEIS
jgi:hypothetical protein